MRTCKTCNETKPLDAEHFYVAKKTPKILYRRTCKECDRTKDREAYRSKSKEERSIIYKKAKERYTYEERQDFKLKNRYGISLEDLNRKLEEQEYRCDCCGTEIKYGSAHIKENNGRLDHCHKTGKVRGIICHPCNTILGMCDDNPKILYNAIDYLKKHD